MEQKRMTELQKQAREIRKKLGLRGYAKFMGAVVGVYKELCADCRISGLAFEEMCPVCKEMAKEKLKKWT